MLRIARNDNERQLRKYLSIRALPSLARCATPLIREATPGVKTRPLQWGKKRPPPSKPSKPSSLSSFSNAPILSNPSGPNDSDFKLNYHHLALMKLRRVKDMNETGIVGANLSVRPPEFGQTHRPAPTSGFGRTPGPATIIARRGVFVSLTGGPPVSQGKRQPPLPRLFSPSPRLAGRGKGEGRQKHSTFLAPLTSLALLPYT